MSHDTGGPNDPHQVAHEIIARRFQVRDDQLWIEDCSAVELAAQFGTPIYCYSQRVLEQTWQALRATFPARFEIYFSMKANPLPEMVKFFVRHGGGIEIASGGELLAARQAGCDLRRLLYAGPGKTDEELSMALTHGVGEIHVESWRELERIDHLAKTLQLAHPVEVALRVNPRPHHQGGVMVMGGRPSPFGIDEEQVVPMIDAARPLQHVTITGLHFNTSTQNLSVDHLIQQYEQILQATRHIVAASQLAIRSLDFGGGLGIPYFAGDRPLDLQRLQAELHRLVTNDDGDSQRWLIEPGRFLVGESGVYLTRVVDVKQSRDQTFIVLDGGMHHHAAGTGNFGQTFRRPFPLVLANRLGARPTLPQTLVGPLCTPLDTWAKQLPWPETQVGDLVAVLQSGAYARSASPVAFLGHRPPAELWIAGSDVQVVRPRGSW